VKLGNNANGTCAIFSEAYWEEALKKSSVFEWHKGPMKRSHVEITNE
jgi:hypothetical protein